MDVAAKTFMTYSDFDFHTSLIIEFNIMGLYRLHCIKETTTGGFLLCKPNHLFLELQYKSLFHPFHASQAITDILLTKRHQGC